MTITLASKAKHFRELRLQRDLATVIKSFTVDEVAEMFILRNKGLTYQAIGERFNSPRQHISRVVRRASSRGFRAWSDGLLTEGE